VMVTVKELVLAAEKEFAFLWWLKATHHPA
jgi:hypothetical protein